MPTGTVYERGSCKVVDGPLLHGQVRAAGRRGNSQAHGPYIYDAPTSLLNNVL